VNDEREREAAAAAVAVGEGRENGVRDTERPRRRSTAVGRSVVKRSAVRHVVRITPPPLLLLLLFTQRYLPRLQTRRRRFFCIISHATRAETTARERPTR